MTVDTRISQALAQSEWLSEERTREIVADMLAGMPPAVAPENQDSLDRDENGNRLISFQTREEARRFLEWHDIYNKSRIENWEAQQTAPYKINDAVVHGEISDEVLNREIEIGFSRKGSKTFPGGWLTFKGLVRQWLDSLSHHVEGAKDGPAFLQGSVIRGDRKAQAVPHLDFLILDLDTGESISELKQRLRKLGLFAVIYTTHSHMKPVTEVKKDAVVKWCSKAEPDVKDVVGYLEHEKRYRPAVLVSATLEPTQHTEKGIMLVLRHKPMPKFRVMLLLKDRFVIAERPGTQKDAILEWKERYAGASKLLGCFFDRSCVDPSRTLLHAAPPERRHGIQHRCSGW